MRRIVFVLLFVFLAAALHAQESDLTVSKSGPETADADTDVAYTVAITNFGPDAATDVTLTDTTPAGMTFVSAMQDSGPLFDCTPLPAAGMPGTIACDALLFPAGETAVFTFVFHIDPATEPGTSFTNIATVAAPADSNEENNSGVAVTTTPFPSADLSVSKSGPSSVAPDRDFSFIVTLINAGPDAATDVVLTDTLPGDLTFVSLMQSGAMLDCTTPAVGSGGTITCTSASYAAGASTTLTITAHVPAAATSGTQYTNSVVVTSDSDPNEENDVSFFTTVVSSVDISVSKSGPPNVAAGNDISYGITVSNAGPDNALAITLADAVPDGTTFVSLVQTSGPFTASCTTPAPGESGTIVCSLALPDDTSATFTLVVEPDPGVTEVTNTATVTSEEFDTDLSDNESSVTTTVTPQADVSVSKSGPPSVAAGADVTYVVTVTNGGPSTAANVVLTDAAPINTTFVSVTQTSGPTFTCGTSTCTIASLAAGATATFEFVFRVAPSATGSIENTATVSTTTPDPASGNDTDTVTTPIVASADLAVVKSGPATATPGTNVTYTVVATNNGPSDASSVTVTDNAPANTTFVSVTQTAGPAFTCGTSTCTIATFTAGASATFEFVFRVAASATGSIENTATIASPAADPTSGNNSSSITTPTAASADLAVAKSGPAAVTAGANATYTVVATNNGPSDAANVTVTDAPPPGTSFVSVTQTAGPPFTCGTTTCTIATFAAGASATFEFVFQVAASATGSIENTATISAATADPNAANNTSTATTGLNPGPTDLAITKTASGTSFGAGSAVTYTIVVTNNGPSVAFGTTVTDPLPPGTTLEAASSTQGSCTGTNPVVCSIGTLAPAATATITLVVRLPRTLGTVTNTATVSAANAETSPANNASTTAVAVVAEIPTAGTWGLLLLAAVLAMVGLKTLPRW